MVGQSTPAGGEFPSTLIQGPQIDPAISLRPVGRCLYVESDNSGSPDYEINGGRCGPTMSTCR